MTKPAQANVDRLVALAGFKRVVCALRRRGHQPRHRRGRLDLGRQRAAGFPLFTVADTSKLRVYVNVPQNYVPAVKLNTKVQITVPEYPGKIYYGVVEASARAVDAASGTTRMQLVVDNSAGELMPGAFANTRIELAGRPCRRSAFRRAR